MTSVDNFKMVAEFMATWRCDEYPDLFYLVQIIRRRKENPDMPTGGEVIKLFEIDNEDDLRKREEEIKFLCDATNSRAYINLNRRSREQVAKYMLKSLAELVYQSNYSTKSLYSHAAGRSYGKSEPDGSLYMIDVDDPKHVQLYIDVAAISSGDAEGFMHTEFPTVNGLHVVCDKFDLRKFNLIMLSNQGENFEVPIPDVHKDNPVLLYHKKLM